MTIHVNKAAIRFFLPASLVLNSQTIATKSRRRDLAAAFHRLQRCKTFLIAAIAAAFSSGNPTLMRK